MARLVTWIHIRQINLLQILAITTAAVRGNKKQLIANPGNFLREANILHNQVGILGVKTTS